MKNIDIMKKELCELITNMDEKELYDTLSVLEDFSETDLPDSILICKKCREMYGDCDDTLYETICKERFHKYCEIEHNE